MCTRTAIPDAARPAAPGAQAIIDFFGITARDGFSLQSNWARLRLAFMLHTNVSHQQNACLEAEGYQFITGIANETGLDYGRMLLSNQLQLQLQLKNRHSSDTKPTTHPAKGAMQLYTCAMLSFVRIF